MLNLKIADNTVLTLARAMADIYPYAPKCLDLLMLDDDDYYLSFEFVHVLQLDPKTLSLVVSTIRNLAEKELAGQDVIHMEMAVFRVRPSGHTSCTMDCRCPACPWLAFTEYSSGYAVGWSAVILRSS